ncbi:putative OPT family oligopeptide transporter [Scopulibacillus daqui]|uniref:OPT family oligopeptide transporter n=1 Tax=Scopulibacillus daqui TaxID=1469162 RepID=A0ABS2Q665_9BACL|nr:oligopeptide transporter, OPT family [Scopulibacillus daqui]MBM7647002.1 putative OPT family oligopeptide transporter [Scopulibacillus daqui]
MDKGSEKSTKFVPYIPASKSLPELTVTAIILGIILAVVFGAANAYLGLMIGMTVSASIPAAVISMGILRGLFKKDSILENNIVQTMTTAGEAIGAGAVFTIPALFMLHIHVHQLMIIFIVLVGGILGVFMMVPLRRLLIVQEHGNLPYPEGTACAEVLKSGEKGGSGALNVLYGVIIGGVFKALGDALKLFKTEVETGIYHFKNAIVGLDTMPSLLGVGFIIGPRIAGQMFAGGLLAWVVFIPIIGFFGQGNMHHFFPATTPLTHLSAWDIYDNYIRYIGAGAVAAGGIITLVKTLPTLFASLKDTLTSMSQNRLSSATLERTDQDISMKWVIGVVILFVIIIAVDPIVHVGLIGAAAIAVLGFLFVTVSSRIVGIVGSSSSPVSGMTIATLLIVALTYKLTGATGNAGIIMTISVAAIVCTAVAVAGDISQDLKTGYLVGATPWKQQIAMLIGVVSSSLVIGIVLYVMNAVYGMGSKALPAPKGVLMKILSQGIMNGQLPWDLIFIGAATAVVIEFMGLNSLTVAVGLYLPVHTSMPIMIGGAVRWLIEKSSKRKEDRQARQDSGTLFASGLIAGESLIGVIIAFLTFAKVPMPANIMLTNGLVSVILFIIVIFSLWFFAFRGSKGKSSTGNP